MTINRQSLGRWGEEKAAAFLSDRGFTILARNARTPYGEIDLVARQERETGEPVVMVEVKTRTSTGFGYPEAAVTGRKREHLKNSAEYYMQQHPELGRSWRIDVIAIHQCAGDPELDIQHFMNAVS